MSVIEDKIDANHVCTEVSFPIALQFIRHALDDSEPIADLQGNKILPGQWNGEIWAALNIEVLRADDGEVRRRFPRPPGGKGKSRPLPGGSGPRGQFAARKPWPYRALLKYKHNYQQGSECTTRKARASPRLSPSLSTAGPARGACCAPGGRRGKLFAPRAILAGPTDLCQRPISCTRMRAHAPPSRATERKPPWELGGACHAASTSFAKTAGT
ncbi:hypothetical protein PR048_029500 [Dryococelus australis]|uniref:Uncharacterized protein n=1 Tax=Dryococelus australis TaxID=614101 RepID=A0ABQ9GFX1_9NEOP|nr:hypothetical protein PR048_029500 [Dryococelus australis]